MSKQKRGLWAVNEQYEKVDEPIYINGKDPLSSGGSSVWEDSDGDGRVQLPNHSGFEVDNHTVRNLAVSLKKTTDQSISASTDTKVNWDKEIIDDNSEFDLANDTFSPSVAGDYTVRFGFLFLNVGDQEEYMARVYKNGALYRGINGVTSGTGSQGDSIAVSLPDLTTSDTVEIYVRIGAAATLYGVGAWTWADIYREG